MCGCETVPEQMMCRTKAKTRDFRHCQGKELDEDEGDEVDEADPIGNTNQPCI